MTDRPYRPSNGTEGAIFEERWCQRCAREDVDKDDLCDIHGNALFGDPPTEWVYKDGKPTCTAFTVDARCEPRCDETMEMF